MHFLTSSPHQCILTTLPPPTLQQYCSFVSATDWPEFHFHGDLPKFTCRLTIFVTKIQIFSLSSLSSLGSICAALSTVLFRRLENIPHFFVPTEQIPAAQRLDAGIFGDLSDGVEILKESSGFPQNPSDPRLAPRQSLAG